MYFYDHKKVLIVNVIRISDLSVSKINFSTQNKQVHLIMKWHPSDSKALTEQLINICKNFKVGKHLLNINYLRGGEAVA